MASARDDSESSYEQEANKRLNLQSKTEVVITKKLTRLLSTTIQLLHHPPVTDTSRPVG